MDRKDVGGKADMTVTVSVKNYSAITMCESITNWTNGTPTLVSDFFKEGSYCLGLTLKNAGYNDAYYAWSGSLTGKHLHLWFMTSALKELTNVQIGLYDGTNYSWFIVQTVSTYNGGWYNISLDCGRTPNYYGSTHVASGTPASTGSITRIYVSLNLSISSKNQQNTWVDSIYTGDGLVAYGDDGGSNFDLADILAVDELKTTNYGWGMIRKIAGIYYLVGSIEIGDSAGTNSTKFLDTGQVIVFENRPVSSSFYYIKVVDNGTGTTEFTLGAKSGSLGISGCVVRVESLTQTPKFDILGNNTNVDNFKLYGTTFLDADSVEFPASATNVEILSCNFESCGEALPNTAKVEYCNFISGNDIACRLASDSHNFKNNYITATHRGIEITISDTAFPLDNVNFSGCDHDIYYTAASGDLTVSLTNGSNASTYEATGTGTVYFSNDVSVNVYVKDEAGNNVVSANVAVYKTSDMTEIMNEATDSNGLASTTYNLSGDTPVTIRVRKSSTSSTRYFPNNSIGTITGTFSTTVVLIQDSIATT